MRDAELLGRLIGNKNGWEDNITAEYEKEMRDYASGNVKDSFGFASKQFGIGDLSVVIN
jgi:hypothetical protein